MPIAFNSQPGLDGFADNRIAEAAEKIVNASNVTPFALWLANCQGKAENADYPNKTIINTLEDLAKAAQRDHIATECKKNHRSNANFLSCSCLLGESDNESSDDPGEWMIPERVSQKLPGVQFAYIGSRNNMKIKHLGQQNEQSARPRHHYYFMLNRPLESLEEAKEILEKLHKVIPELDPNAKDAVRFFYGFSSPDLQSAGFFPGSMDIVEYFHQHPEIQLNKAPNKSEKKGATSFSSSSASEFLQLNIKEILLHIPAACTEKKWAFVGKALKYEGFDFSLFDWWSSLDSGSYNKPDGRGRTGSEMTWAKWKAIKPEAAYNGGYLINRAKENGWNPEPQNLTGEYKENHEAAEEARRILEDHKAEEHKARREELRLFCQEIGIEYKESLTYTRNFDGNISSVIDEETGKILFNAHSDHGSGPDPEEDGSESDAEAANKAGVTLNKASGTKSAKEEITPFEEFDSEYFNTAIIEEPKPIIENILYPGFSMLGAPPKMGKSYMALQLAICVASGEPFMGFKIERPGEVLYLDLQGTKARTLKRLRSMGYRKMPDGITMVYRSKRTDTGVLQQIEQWINSPKRKRKPSLIIVDMLAQIKGSQKKTEDAYMAENRILEPLHNLAIAHDIALFCTAHTRKGNSRFAPGDPFDEIIGSSGQFGTADCAWTILGKRTEDQKQFSVICRDNDAGQQDYEATFKDHRWSVTGTTEEVTAARASEEYKNGPIRKTLRHLLLLNNGKWKGTMQELYNEIALYTKEYPAPDAARLGRMITGLRQMMNDDGIIVSTPTAPPRQYTFLEKGMV